MKARIEKSEPCTVPQHTLGPMNVECSGCGSLNFEGEGPKNKLFQYCCHKGKIKLEPYKFPVMIEKLMTNDKKSTVWPTAEQRNNFMENIRCFNSALAFASMGGPYQNKNGDDVVPNGGIYCFKVFGQIYHATSKSVHPKEGEKRKYAQLYMLDSDQASNERMDDKHNKGCDKTTMQKLSDFMSTENELAKSYKMMQEVERSLTRNGELPSLTLSFRKNPQSDQRRYNAPAANEIAVVFENIDGEPPFERDIRVYNKNTSNGATTQINILHEKCDAMLYPLPYPYGDDGWHIGRKVSMSQMGYYAYILAIRKTFNPFISAGKLTQQFVVDAHVKTEANRLNFIRHNQAKLRVEKYKGLMDHLTDRAIRRNLGFEKLGIPIILPSSFLGSVRNMQQRYQDAMAVVGKFGKPDLFITMTCNPKWPEIADNLNGCKTENRPDLIAKVFNLKLKAFLADVKHGKVFGRIRAMVYVIEFQKRGLPHVHMLIILCEEDKPRSTEDIDKIVWAEIPEKEKYPELYQVVTKHMIHGPCGVRNPKSPCMENGKCKKQFPKSFQEETDGNVNGYALYQRRNLPQHSDLVQKGVDNSWVVPYNPYMSQKFNCHINVEVCASVRSVKYLYKYVYKGYDCADVDITHDEVKNFLDSRYISPPEAMWRTNGYPMYWQSHAIVRLAVHLEMEQSVVFHEGLEKQATENIKDTTLLAWFKLNQQFEEAAAMEENIENNQNVAVGDAFDEAANIEVPQEDGNVIEDEEDDELEADTESKLDVSKLLYTEIPKHFVFKKGVWVPRKKRGNTIISRMYTVGINENERFYLRLLLLHVRGAKSYEDLKTVDGVVHPTFKDACKARLLLADDTEWDNALTEAADLKSPNQIRLTFALICAHGNPVDCLSLWNKHKSAMTEDFVYHKQSNPENRALLDVESIVRQNSTDYNNLGLPKTTPIVEIVSEYDIDSEREKGERLVLQLNPEQKYIYDMVMKAIDDYNEPTRYFFIDGPGGSGKTFLYNTFLSVLRGRGEGILPVASTGIAGTLLEGGTTYHSQFKLPVPLKDTSSSKIRMRSIEADQIRKAKLTVWDEAGMTPGIALKVVDRLLKEVFDNKDNFGNMVTLFGGDFHTVIELP